MDDMPRHQCLIYSGARTKQLAHLAATILAHLHANYRCLYVHTPAMVEGIRSYLTASGMNVSDEVFRKRLVLVSDQSHLCDGVFDPQRMIAMLETACNSAVADGHAGLWASGDMGWEFGPNRDFSKLLEYERALEALFETQPKLRGVCQYHVDMLPAEAADVAAITHPALYVNETLSKINPRYKAP